MKNYRSRVSTMAETTHSFILAIVVRITNLKLEFHCNTTHHLWGPETQSDTAW